MLGDHEGDGAWAVESVAGLLTRASGELVERLLAGGAAAVGICVECSKQKQASQTASTAKQAVAIDKADDTTMR